MCSLLNLKLYPRHINGVTAVAKNRLFYNNGSVQFAENIPPRVKMLFLKNGSGHNLANYNTSLQYDKNILLMRFEKIPGMFKKFMNKIFKSSPTVYERQFDTQSANYVRQLSNFISTNAMSEHVKKINGGGFWVSLIDRLPK